MFKKTHYYFLTFNFLVSLSIFATDDPNNSHEGDISCNCSDSSTRVSTKETIQEGSRKHHTEANQHKTTSSSSQEQVKDLGTGSSMTIGTDNETQPNISHKEMIQEAPRSGNDRRGKPSSYTSSSSSPRVVLDHEGTTTRDPFSRATKTSGGVTTGVLRYPHLISSLINYQLNTDFDSNQFSLLILGPGNEETISRRSGRISSPQLHEILGVFPPETRVTVVDNDDFIQNLGESVYGDLEKKVARSVMQGLKKHKKSNRISNREIDKISNYIDNLSENIQQLHINFIQNDFADFKPNDKYNFIFALQSLMYSLDSAADRKAGLKIIANYLGALKNNGLLVIDHVTYIKMREFLKSLPSVGIPAGQEIYWNYPKSNHKFMIVRVRLPFNPMDNPDPRLIFYYPGDLGKKLYQYVSTTEVFFIERLPKDETE